MARVWRHKKVVPHRIKPLVRALVSPVFKKHGHIAISRALEEELFRSAEVLSEGSCKLGREGNDSYFGSTMITFDLRGLERHCRGCLDRNTKEMFARAVEGSVRMRLRAMRIAQAEVARRVSDRPLDTALIETRIRLDGDHLYLDMDLEVPLGVSSYSRKR